MQPHTQLACSCSDLLLLSVLCHLPQVYVYVGTKKYDPYGQLDPLDAAGLLKGKLYGIKLEDFPQESFVAMPPNGQVEFR